MAERIASQLDPDRSEQPLDVHWITDKDIEKQSSFAAKIGAVTDAARPLPMGTNLSDGQ